MTKYTIIYNLNKYANQSTTNEWKIEHHENCTDDDWKDFLFLTIECFLIEMFCVSSHINIMFGGKNFTNIYHSIYRLEKILIYTLHK